MLWHICARTFLLVLLCAVSTVVAGNGLIAAQSTVTIQVLSLASWRGQLEPLQPGLGGAATLAAYWQADRDFNPNAVTLGTGESFGTSPPISNAFEDRPTIEALNAMGLDADTLGDNNFDSGLDSLQRLVNMADFPVVSANLKNLQANLTDVQPYSLLTVGGIRAAIIGVTNPASRSLVFPGNFGTIELSDPGVAAMQARLSAAEAGAEVFILITEMGVSEVDGQITNGPLIDLATAVSGFDLVLGGDGDFDYQGRVNGALVVQSRSRGASYARTTLLFDTNDRKVGAASTEFVVPLSAGIQPDKSLDSLVASYRTQLAGQLSQILANSMAGISSSDACGEPSGRTCESLAGDVIADAMRQTYETDFALINAGAIRADLTCESSSPVGFCPEFSPPPFPITAGQIEASLPFGNLAAVTEVSGAEIKAYLENSVAVLPEPDGRFAQVSGLCFLYDISKPPGARILAATRHTAEAGCSAISLDLSSTARYSLTTNDFIAAGGDGYQAITADNRDLLTQVMKLYLESREVLNPGLQQRITCTSSGDVKCPSGSSTSTANFAGVVSPPTTGDAGLVDP